MKTTFFYSLLVVLSFSLLSSTCSSDDDGNSNSNNNSEEIQAIVNTISSGTWHITSYIDSGQDDTNDFNGYDFVFDTNGTLTASNSSTNYTGTWSINNDSNNSSSSSSDDIDFNIFFSVPDSNNFEDLNDDWDIVTHTETRIDLIDISSGNGGTDTLTFEKN